MGSIRRQDEPNSRFLWVYDCGTSSSQLLLESSINQLKHFARNRLRIDMLILSHFDHDHISGITRLLKEFKVGTLLLPYMTLAQRLVIAFEEGSGGADDPMTGFFLNPVTYLLERSELGIERILFVPPGGESGPPYPGAEPGPQDSGSDQPQLTFTPDKPEDLNEAKSLLKASHDKGRHPSIDFLRPGSSITLAICHWEFVPYNEDIQNDLSPAFIKEVETARDSLLSTKADTSRDESLKKLKLVYDYHFGRQSEERNVISLFLYAGPIYPSWTLCLPTEGRSRFLTTSPLWQFRRLFPYMPAWRHSDPLVKFADTRCSILYTGDGYLDTNKRLQNLIRYIGVSRVQKLFVFQVMHHGAEANWHQGTAEAFSPHFSIFCSDPDRKKWKHPNAMVLRDFWQYGAVIVDKHSDFTANGRLMA